VNGSSFPPDGDAAARAYRGGGRQKPDQGQEPNRKHPAFDRVAEWYLQSTDFDLAIIDVNLDGEPIFPVAEAIKARNRPLIFATGYNDLSVLPDEYRDRPSLQ
jgi:CheY-like chemotaxis protein